MLKYVKYRMEMLSVAVFDAGLGTPWHRVQLHSFSIRIMKFYRFKENHILDVTVTATINNEEQRRTPASASNGIAQTTYYIWDFLHQFQWMTLRH